MPFTELFDRLLRGRSEQLSWNWIPDANIVGGVDTTPLQAHQSYVVVRLAEMFLRDQRVLWKKFYPTVYGFVTHGGRELSEVAGPGQLKELGTANLDRLVGLSYRLAGPIVYAGTDLDLLVGLYAVPAQDAAKALLGALSSLSKLSGISADAGLKIADVVKTGLEGVLNIDGTTMQLGARDTLRPSATGATGKVAQAGFLLAVNAPARAVDYKRLWVKDGRLYYGQNPDAALPYDEHDYMLIEVERRDQRADWASLPEILRHEQEFAKVFAERDLTPEDRKQRIRALWPPFVGDVQGSQELTYPDKARVQASVKKDLQDRIDMLTDGMPFAGPGAASFDFLEVADAFEGQTPEAVQRMTQESEKLPF